MIGRGQLKVKRFRGIEVIDGVRREKLTGEMKDEDEGLRYIKRFKEE